MTTDADIQILKRLIRWHKSGATLKLRTQKWHKQRAELLSRILKLTEEAMSERQKLYDYMCNAYGLNLLHTEIDDIISIACTIQTGLLYDEHNMTEKVQSANSALRQEIDLLREQIRTQQLAKCECKHQAGSWTAELCNLCGREIDGTRKGGYTDEERERLLSEYLENFATNLAARTFPHRKE